jgi:hypothetical protein
LARKTSPCEVRRALPLVDFGFALTATRQLVVRNAGRIEISARVIFVGFQRGSRT